MIKEYRMKCTSLESDLQGKEETIHALNVQLNDQKVEIQSGDSKGLRIIQLENQILQDQKSCLRDKGRLRVAHRNEMQR